MFVLYPESQQAAIDYCKQNLPCAWALHDKDVYSQAAFDDYVKKHEGTLPDWMPGDLKKPHIHFVCSSCGAVYDVPADLSGIVREAARCSGHDSCWAEVTAHGLCSTCAAEKAEAKTSVQ